MRTEVHPSGHDLKRGAFSRDNGGSIPGNMLWFSNVEHNTAYVQGCKKEGLPIHPARMPIELPRFFIKLLTRKGGLVWDPCAGSGKTGEAAEELGRRWVTSDSILDYVQGSRFRFPHSVSY